MSRLKAIRYFNLAEAYLEKSSYSPVQHDSRKPKEKMLLQRIADLGGGSGDHHCREDVRTWA